MKSVFSIYQSCANPDRPPISYKVREYFEKFITTHVLEKKGVIVDGRWKIVLGITFLAEGGRYTLRELFFPKGQPRTVTRERTKVYEIIVPLQLIQGADNRLLKTIDLMYESITVFLT